MTRETVVTQRKARGQKGYMWLPLAAKPAPAPPLGVDAARRAKAEAEAAIDFNRRHIASHGSAPSRSRCGCPMGDLLPTERRDHLDRDYTPDEVAAAFVRWLRIPAVARVLEPSVGGGAWVRALRGAGRVVIGADIDPGARGLAMVDIPLVGDFAGEMGQGNPSPLFAAGPFDLVLGNPPFGPALAHLRRALALAPVVAFVLRQTFIQPTPKGVVRNGVQVSEPRRDFLRANPPWAVWYWPDRIAFGGAAGSDSVLHGLHIWRRGHTGDSWTTTMCRVDDPRWMPPVSPWGPL